MTVLLLPDKFKGSLTAEEVILALTKGIDRADNSTEIHQMIASDGGDGFLDAIQHTVEVEVVHCTAVDPLGREIKASYLVNIHRGEAFIELAKTSGMEILNEKERNPMITSTLGTGMQIRDAVKRGVRTIYVGLGGSATNDGGIGIAHAMGYKFLDEQQNTLAPIGESLARIHSIDASDV
ncbi:MAG: glycerate kinase, partial [Eudoraea sp.]|nr:glycerate kinase [Eudoraea sp.]